MFKPEGLIIPDCHCFQTKLATMNNAIDTVSAINSANICKAGILLNICDKARDYFVAAFIADALMILLKPTKHVANQAKEYEDAYERIKPLIMQRLEYADGVVDAMEGGK